jgi:hypothetical protein
MTCRRAFAITLALALGAGAIVVTTGASAEEAKGAVSYKGATLALKYAFLVKGPDAIDRTKIIRRVIFATTDLAAKIRACQTMSCVDGLVDEGMTLDLDAGPRLNYWTGLKGGLVQYSGTARPSALSARTDEPGRVAGKLGIDDTAAGGAKVEVEFDVKLLKELKAAR